jgi:hypothetical protein
MTIKDYLNNYLQPEGKIENTKIDVYTTSVQGRGTITVEYYNDEDRAEILHYTRDKRDNFYSATTLKELKDTIEYCLGPLVSDKDWNQTTELPLIDDSYEDDYCDGD